MSFNNEKYDEMLRNEKTHYSNLLEKQEKNSKIIQKIEPKIDAFQYAYSISSSYKKQKCPSIPFEQYILQRAKSHKKISILSLGCGTAEWEIELLEKEPEKIRCEVVDINEELLEKAKEISKQKNLNFHTIIHDINEIKLIEEKYDLIIARSSLHHFIKLEDIFSEINKSLTPDGKFIVIGEVIGKNGLMLYEQTKVIAQKIFDILPEKS